MAHDEDDIKAAAIITHEQVKALIKIYGYDPFYLGRVEDVHVDRIINDGLKADKTQDVIAKESGRSISTVKRRKNERLGIKKKKPAK